MEGSLGDDVSVETFSAVDRRTPSFASWQATQWFFHCGDGAMFLGPAGAAELAPFPDALEMLRHELSEWEWPADQVEHCLSSLDKNGQPTAYLFRCRVCAAHLAYSDFTWARLWTPDLEQHVIQTHSPGHSPDRRTGEQCAEERQPAKPRPFITR